MKIVFVHYNIDGEGGVNSVMWVNAESIKKIYKKAEITFIGYFPKNSPKIPDVKYVNFPEIAVGEDFNAKYASQDVFDYLRQGEGIYKKLDKLIKDNVDYVIIENPNIGIHPAATYGFYRYAKKNEEQKRKMKVCFRIHDFAEDRKGNFLNLLKFVGRERSPYWHKISFPKRDNLGYAVINSTDIRRIKGHGHIEEGKLFYVPNPIKESLRVTDTKTSEKLRKLIINKHKLADDVKFILYPVRVIPRKNIEEAIFVTVLVNYQFKQNYHLIVTLRENTAECMAYAKELEKFVKKNKLPATIGLPGLITLKRTKKNGKIHTFGIGDIYNICDKVISTSILEGFGLFFIESWFHDKALIGRDLPLITPDFKHHGIDLEHLYSSLFIDGHDFKDIKGLKNRLNIILKLKNPKFRGEIFNKNKHSLEGLFRLFEEDYEKKLIQSNKNQVIAHFSEGHIAKKLISCLKNIH